jgi:O-antigen/teichoic acid export membrane protein
MVQAFAYQLLRGLRAFGEIALLAFLGSVLQVAGVTVGALWIGANGALAGYILFSVPTLFALRRVRLIGPVESPPDVVRMRRYAVSFYFAVLFSPLLWVRADTLIVDQTLGAGAVGLFAAASTLAALLIQVCQMICNALLPNIVNAGRYDREVFARLSRIAVRTALPLLLPACLIAAAAAPDAIRLVYGPAFAAGGTTAAILCLAAVGSALTLIVATVLNAGEDNAVLARNGMIGAVVTVVAGTVLALKMGIVGAALGRLASQGVMGLLNLRSANQQVKGLLTASWIARTLLAGSLGAAATMAVSWWLGGGGLALILALSAGGATYLLAAPLLLPFAPDERRRFVAMLEPLPLRMGRPAAWLLSVGRSD